MDQVRIIFNSSYLPDNVEPTRRSIQVSSNGNIKLFILDKLVHASPWSNTARSFAGRDSNLRGDARHVCLIVDYFGE